MAEEEYEEKVKALIEDTLTLMCKNGLQFKNKLRVEGALDNAVVIRVGINECIQNENQDVSDSGHEQVRGEDAATKSPCMQKTSRSKSKTD